MSTGYALLAAGGTGGHMFPAQALAEALHARGWRVALSTDERGARYATNFPPQVKIDVVDSATFARGGLAQKAKVPFKLMNGVRAASARFKKDRPDIVVGFGGYPTIPALSAAGWRKIPSMIHEQNGVMGRVNSLFAKRVDLVACGTWPTELPQGVEALHAGNPVRAAVAEHAAAPYILPTPDAPLTLTVFGGSQGARILSDVVPTAVCALPEHLRKRLRVTQQARPEDIERVTRAYESAGISAEVSDFFTDIPDHIAGSTLVIARAGASSVADITVIGRPSILVPYAAATNNHQVANSVPLVEAGAAEMMIEPDFTSEALSARLGSLLSTPTILASMSEAALSAGIPDATERLVAAVEDLATSSAQHS